MALVNMNSNHFTDNEKTNILNTLTAVETALAKGLVNLSNEERQKFGSINEQNKLVVNKVKEFYDNQPTLGSPDVDWVEFNNDYDSRKFIEDVLLRLEALRKGLESAKILHDYDNYQASLIEYGYAQYKKGSGAVGYDAKIDALKQFFTRSTGGNNNNPSKNSDDPTNN